MRTFSEPERRDIDFKDIDWDAYVYTTTLAERHNPTIQSIIGYYAEKVRQDSRLIGGNAILHGKIKQFIAGYLFGRAVDLDDPDVLTNLAGIEARNTILEATKKAVNAATVRDQGAAEPTRMMSLAREIRPHVVAPQAYLLPDRSILNRIVGDSHFELEVAAFLDKSKEIVSFLKNSPSTHFHIEYQTADGGIANYYPDFVVKENEKAIWIVETKGREDLDDPRKWGRLVAWCEDASRADPAVSYRPLYIAEERWRARPPRDFRELRGGFVVRSKSSA